MCVTMQQLLMIPSRYSWIEVHSCGGMLCPSGPAETNDLSPAVMSSIQFGSGSGKKFGIRPDLS